jgi:integrase
VADMRRRYQEAPRERVLTDAEIKTLWWGLENPKLPASRPVALALKFVLATMVRPGQSAGAMIAELVDLEGGDPQYHIPKSRVKKRRDVIVPLNELATAVAREAIVLDEQIAVFTSWSIQPASDEEQPDDRGTEQPKAPAPLTRDALAAALNGRPAKGKRRARRGIRAFLGMQHFTPHDLRRTAATIARRGGARREDVKALLDHLEGDVTATYDKYDMLVEKRAVANILATELQKIVGDRPKVGKQEDFFERVEPAPEEKMGVPRQYHGTLPVQAS